MRSQQISCISVFKTLQKVGVHPDVARVITRISTVKGDLSQGALTSPYLAGLYLDQKIGLELKGLIQKGYRVTVYMDDVIISAPFDFRGEVQSMEKLVSMVAPLNHGKTFYRRLNTTITGCTVSTNGTKINS